MKLLLLLSTLGSGGAERVMTLLANHWVEEGHEVSLMTTFGRHVEAAFPLDPRVELLGPTGGRERSAQGRLRRLLALRRLMRDGQFDGVVSFLTNVNVAAIIARTGVPVPLVVGERTYPPSFPLSRAMEFARRQLYPYADRVVMQTEDGAGWLAQRIPSARGLVIANPVLWPVPTASPIVSVAEVAPPGRKLLLAMGRLSPEKRFDLLLKAFARLASDMHDWDLVIGGQGPERTRLETMRERLGLQDRVSLPGQIGNVADWLRRADAFAFTSSFEGYPNALLEAAALGVPVAAIDCLTGVRDLVASGVNGVLAPRDSDAARFADALRAVLTATWPEASAHAKSIRDSHSIAFIADQWLSALQAPRT